MQVQTLTPEALRQHAQLNGMGWQVNASNPTASRGIVDLFADVMDLSRDRSRLDMYMCRKALTPRKAPSPRYAASERQSCRSDQRHACISAWLLRAEHYDLPGCVVQLDW